MDHNSSFPVSTIGVSRKERHLPADIRIVLLQRTSPLFRTIVGRISEVVYLGTNGHDSNICNTTKEENDPVKAEETSEEIVNQEAKPQG
jgi:hypothetical protein